MKTFVFVAFLFAFAQADLLKASCRMDISVDLSCTEVKNTLTDRLNNFNDPKKGQYKYIESNDDSVHGSRTTASGEYTDDVYFTFGDATSNSPCKFEGYSQSRVTSFYDYSTNYCNMRNLVKDLAGAETSPQGWGKCLFHNEDQCTPQ